MAKKKKKKAPHIDKSPVRKRKAKQWLQTYTGDNIVKDYREHFRGVDVACAVRELREIGYKFELDYEKNVLNAENDRIAHIHREKEKKQQSESYYNDFQDDNFYFIAGYTSGGAPYGVQWWEMGLEPYEDEDDFDDKDIYENVQYDFLSEYEKNSINGKLRESFSQYVKTYRRFPSKTKKQELIEKVFAQYRSGSLIYTKNFGAHYRKIVRKRENEFIREGVLPKRFSPTQIQKFYEQSVMLDSERFIFRKITENDFDDLAEMLRDSEVMTAWEHTFSDDEIRKWIDKQITRYRDHIVGYFAAIDKETNEFIGQMGLMWNDFNELRALEIGYMLKRKYWGKGFATEGATALAQYAFDTIGVNRVYASIRPENTQSIRVAERIGMTADGNFIKPYNGKDMEHMIYYKDKI